MLWTLFSGFHLSVWHLINLPNSSCEVGFRGIHILQTRKLRLWEVKSPVKYYTANCQHHTAKSVLFPLAYAASSQHLSMSYPGSKVQCQANVFQKAFSKLIQRSVPLLSFGWEPIYRATNHWALPGCWVHCWMLYMCYLTQYSNDPRSQMVASILHVKIVKPRESKSQASNCCCPTCLALSHLFITFFWFSFFLKKCTSFTFFLFNHWVKGRSPIDHSVVAVMFWNVSSFFVPLTRP